MNVEKVTAELKTAYPGKNIIINDPDHPTEIVCEIEPASENPERSVAIAVLDSTVTHLHRETTEVYEVIRGMLEVNLMGLQHILHERESLEIKPGQFHSAKGKETWVKVTSTPGWRPEDHILQNEAS